MIKELKTFCVNHQHSPLGVEMELVLATNDSSTFLCSKCMKTVRVEWKDDIHPNDQNYFKRAPF